MEEVKNELNFTGDLAAFNSYLLQNAAFKYTDKDSMLKDGIFTCPDGRTSLDSDFKQ